MQEGFGAGAVGFGGHVRGVVDAAGGVGGRGTFEATSWGLGGVNDVEVEEGMSLKEVRALLDVDGSSGVDWWLKGSEKVRGRVWRVAHRSP